MNIVNSLVAILFWLSIVVVLGVICKKFLPNQKELSRKIIHIGCGPLIPLAWWLEIPRQYIIPLALSITIGLIINKKFGYIKAIEDVQRKSFGTIGYGASISILLILLWPNNAPAVSVGVLAMALGDGLAGLIGRQLISPSWLIFGQRKSTAGTLIMGFLTLTIFLLMSLFTGIELNILKTIFLTGLVILAEQIGPWGLDNLTVPISAAFGWLWITG